MDASRTGGYNGALPATRRAAELLEARKEERRPV
jgi:hypothetical protein